MVHIVKCHLGFFLKMTFLIDINIKLSGVEFLKVCVSTYLYMQRLDISPNTDVIFSFLDEGEKGK